MRYIDKSESGGPEVLVLAEGPQPTVSWRAGVTSEKLCCAFQISYDFFTIVK